MGMDATSGRDMFMIMEISGEKEDRKESVERVYQVRDNPVVPSPGGA